MSVTEELLAALVAKDFVRFRLTFEDEYSAHVDSLHRSLLKPLTERERLVCYLMILGEPMDEIAIHLNISVQTVRTHSK